ncbi:glutamate racemase [Faecalicoccus pleomorphus]|uniref:glutamate racemase n=1 Tax=Faecalicoccus pleomorphus TaxID=1323 RepID=UPI0025A34B68|nr:glutamate racemase [Faecalicoccus pleomorphus]MDM8292355.1 glutamate racemase [Faecalicoccus pleomorphus]
MQAESPIGIFDSGLGGISVLHTIHQMMPGEDLIYIGDSKYNPYGIKTKEEITERCLKICDVFMELGCKAIVIACNTATSACVPLLREKYPIDIIGMEPALKVACSLGEKQRIAVWATSFTLKEEKFANLMHRFDQEHQIDRIPCPDLVELVEKDQLGDTKKVKDTLNFYIQKDQGESLDSIVLGCTHFIFYKKTLRQLLPDSVQIVDGNEGTAAHLKDLLGQKQLLSNKKTGKVEIKNTLEEKVEYSKKLFQRLEECK